MSAIEAQEPLFGATLDSHLCLHYAFTRLIKAVFNGKDFADVIVGRSGKV